MSKINRWDISTEEVIDLLKDSIKESYASELTFLIKSKISSNLVEDRVVKTLGDKVLTYLKDDVYISINNELILLKDHIKNKIDNYENFIIDYKKKVSGFTLANFVIFEMNNEEESRFSQEDLLFTKNLMKGVFEECSLDIKKDFKSFIVVLSKYFTNLNFGNYIESETIKKIFGGELLDGCGIRGRDELFGVLNKSYFELLREVKVIDNINDVKEKDLIKNTISPSSVLNKKISKSKLKNMINYVSEIEVYEEVLEKCTDNYKNEIIKIMILDKEDIGYLFNLLYKIDSKKDILDRYVKELFSVYDSFKLYDERTRCELLSNLVLNSPYIDNKTWEKIVNKNLDILSEDRKYDVYYYLIREPNNIFKKRDIGIGNSKLEEDYKPLVKIMDVKSNENNMKILSFNKYKEIYRGYRFKNNSNHLGLYIRHLEDYLTMEKLERGEVGKSLYEIDFKSESQEKENHLKLVIEEMLRSFVNLQDETLDNILNKVEKRKIEEDIKNIVVSKKNKKLKF